MIFHIRSGVLAVDGHTFHGDQCRVLVGRIFTEVGVIDFVAQQHHAVGGDAGEEHVGLAGGVHTVDAAAVAHVA